MRIFVINLARRPDRLLHMRSQLSGFERIEAVDGQAADVQSVSRFRFWCAKGYCIRPGEIGCAMSHQAVYRRVLDEKIDVACILEDDVTLLPGFTEKIAGWESVMTTDVPMVLTFGVTAAGYLINRSGAELMLRLNTPIRSTVDDWWRWERGGLRWRKAEWVITVPPYGDPTSEGIAKSDIIGDARHFVRNKSLVGKATYRAGRVFGKTIDWCLEAMR